MTFLQECQNIPQIFRKRCELNPQKISLSKKNYETGAFEGISWQVWSESVEATAAGLYRLGCQAGDRVAILSGNCPEWTFADLGVLSLRAVVVPVYPTLSYDEVVYILNDAKARFLFVRDDDSVSALKGLFEDVATLEKIIVFDNGNQKGEKVISLSQLMQGQEDSDEGALFNWQENIDQVKKDDLATLIYTSGTTGKPKGVMLSHGNFIENLISAGAFIKISEDDLALSFLPLSHVFERLAGYYFMMAYGASITYAESMLTVGEDIGVVKPTVAAAVPRFYEKVYAKMLEKVESGSALTKNIFHWAKKVGCLTAQIKLSGKRIPFLLSIQSKIADALVFKKLRAKMGGRLRFFISGGAPLSRDLAEFFYSAGVLILEGYGLTETSPVISVNAPDNFKFGYVGKVLPNIKVKIAEDGEILTAGPCVMKGYFNNVEATEEVMSGEWFHTGDIGELDSEGYLKITDRKKDIIVTSGGKNVAPQKIEKDILREDLFLQCVVIGDKRNYLVALVVLNESKLKSFCDEKNISGCLEELIKQDAVRDWIEECFNAQQCDLAGFEQIKYFAILPSELTQESGELTPTMKVKRKVVTSKYSDILDQLYQQEQRTDVKRIARCIVSKT